MNPALILNDWRLTLIADGVVVYEEPAAALESTGGLLFGADAFAKARVHPRQSNLDYLGRLSADPLAQPFTAARNHADLLYLHFKMLAESQPALAEPLLAVVPSPVSNEQLSLLLGVAKEAGVTIGGFTDLASACIAAQPGEAPLQFLELNMTSAYVVRVDLKPETAAGPATEFMDTSISRIIDGWTNVIADQFVASSRFDPLHAAHTEQQLYNLVAGWFGSATPSSYLTIEHGGETRRQEVSIDALRSRLSRSVESLVGALNPDLPVRLGPNAASVPLLRALLETRFGVQRSDGDRLRAWLASHAVDLVSHDDVRYHRTLQPAASTQQPAPSQPAAAVAAPRSATSVSGKPTHGLHATTAYRIGSPALPAAAVGDADSGTTVNVDGRLFTLIEVLD